MTTTNEWGQPIGDSLGNWGGAVEPGLDALVGRTVALRPLDPNSDAASIYDAFVDAPESLFTYLPYGPFESPVQAETVVASYQQRADWHGYVVEVREHVTGFIFFLRINPTAGSTEIGAVTFSPALQRTIASTEAQFLLMAYAFALGNRRLEWKCDALNAGSTAAAERLGYTYEGTFRKATHYRGRNRDTAWFSITDDEWPAIRAGFEIWLAPENFDGTGKQIRSLAQCRREGKLC